MKKIFLSVLAVAAMTLTVSAKKPASNFVVTLDFTNGFPFTAVQGTTQEKVTPSKPAYGFTIPTKSFKEVSEAVAAGYVSCPNPEKGTEGCYLPCSRQSFQSGGKTYEITFGTAASKGKKALISYGKKGFKASRPVFTFPSVNSMLPSGIKIYVKGMKKVSSKYVFNIYKGKVSSKAILASTNAPEEAGVDAVLAANLDGVTAEDFLLVSTKSSFSINKIEFLYSKDPKAAKAKKASK